jgi:predicted AAA+ superfamily ATPase
MISRLLADILLQRLGQSPAVALLGSRQVGKTTLARGMDLGKPIHYLDLERPSDLAKLADPELYLSGFGDRLVILDEVQRLPGLFPVLRSLIDERRRAREKVGQFLLLGSASPALLQQSSETLAGRISYLELTPFQLMELAEPERALPNHWERGGYPDSYLAEDAASSVQWREDFITSYVERFLTQQNITASPLLLRRFCSMLAHQQGATINLSKLGGSLGIDAKTARRYIDLLEGLYLVRSLPPWSRNVGKRLVKSANCVG